MGMYSRNISTLIGKVLEGIDVVDGKVFFIVVDIEAEQTIEYVIDEDYPAAPHFIVDIEGDLADLIDTPITYAEYDPYLMAYIVQSALGKVYLSADGPDTSFGAT